MFLTGSYQRSLDEKCRFTLPKSIRDVLEQSGGLVLYMAPGTDGSLVVYTEESFQRLGDQLGQGPPTAQDIRAFSRLFYCAGSACGARSAGSGSHPGGLGGVVVEARDIVLIGVRDHLEVWDRERWQGILARSSRFMTRLPRAPLAARPAPRRASVPLAQDLRKRHVAAPNTGSR